METQDTLTGKETMEPPVPTGRVTLDRLELKHEWEQQAEEQQAEDILNRYASAARARMQSSVPDLPDSAETEEEREANSQRLKLQQKCQDIAALILVDELEEETDS